MGSQTRLVIGSLRDTHQYLGTLSLRSVFCCEDLPLSILTLLMTTIDNVMSLPDLTSGISASHQAIQRGIRQHNDLDEFFPDGSYAKDQDIAVAYYSNTLLYRIPH